jgi:hypothetical protein
MAQPRREQPHATSPTLAPDLSLDGLLHPGGHPEDKDDETKDWSAEKLFSETKDSVRALRSHFPFNRATFGARNN